MTPLLFHSCSDTEVAVQILGLLTLEPSGCMLHLYMCDKNVQKFREDREILISRLRARTFSCANGKEYVNVMCSVCMHVYML